MQVYTMSVFLTFFIFGLGKTLALGYCSFPSYLWTSAASKTKSPTPYRNWITGTEYIGNSGNWSKQKQITVMKTEIEIIHRVFTLCEGEDGVRNVQCYPRTLRKRLICVQKEIDGKYRVQQRSRGRSSRFTCIKFIRRAEGVVQMYAAVPQDENEGRLCRDAVMHRNEWPWIDPDILVWYPCPLVGGFDFRSSFQPSCNHDILPSRFESECMRGDGMVFYFTNETCNFFSSGELNYVCNQELQCVTSWVEDIYRFILMAEPSFVPRYVLRLPIHGNTLGETKGHLYMSAFMPTSLDGRPPRNVMFVTMEIWPSGTGTCYDEYEHCDELASEGKCHDPGFLEKANHCMRSCGMCDEIPSTEPECYFHENVFGTWYMFDDQDITKLHIEDGVADIDGLGRFMCKSKHWFNDFYRTLSVFDNGCRPRYSCVQFQPGNHGLLHYTLSKSSLTDTGFSLCKFESDPPPLMERFRTQYPRTLFNTEILQFSTCNMSAMHHVTALLTNSSGYTRHCDGTISDITMDTCHVTSTAHIDLNRCDVPHPNEMDCIAHTVKPSGTGFLVAQFPEISITHYFCYVIKASNPIGNWPSVVLQYKRAQCNTANIRDISYFSTPYLNGDTMYTIENVDVYGDQIEHRCVGKSYPLKEGFTTLSANNISIPSIKINDVSSSTSSVHNQQSGSNKHDFDINVKLKDDSLVYIAAVRKTDLTSSTLSVFVIRIHTFTLFMVFIVYMLL